MREMEDRDRIEKMLKRRPVIVQEPPKTPGEYVDELRDEITAEALTEAQSKHERSQELWNA